MIAMRASGASGRMLQALPKSLPGPDSVLIDRHVAADMQREHAPQAFRGLGLIQRPRDRLSEIQPSAIQHPRPQRIEPEPVAIGEPDYVIVHAVHVRRMIA